jgi:undecaprenyl-diphosphatase
MTISIAILLGFVQGLTEFLPISSSGHLVLLQKVLGFSEPPVFFDVLVHLGTLLAVVVFLGRDLIRAARKLNVVRVILLGTLPAAAVGLLLQGFVDTLFNSLLIVGLAYFFTAALLWWSRGIGEGDLGRGRISDRRALIIGLFQAVAIIPGVSRSGSTIVAGLSQGLDRETAFKFSFYLFIPAVLGALVLQIKDQPAVLLSPADFWGMLTAFVVGYFSLLILRRVLLSGKLYYFSFYCALLGLLSFLIFITSR